MPVNIMRQFPLIPGTHDISSVTNDKPAGEAYGLQNE
jgi:hypothetical protein